MMHAIVAAHNWEVARHDVPYRWARVSELFIASVAADLAVTFPAQYFREVAGDDGEKSWRYYGRPLVAMDGRVISAASLSPSWDLLAHDLLSEEYRSAISSVAGVDLGETRVEVNAFRYGPGTWLGPHCDLREKLVTHVLYFNPRWDDPGGCFQVLGSSSAHDVVATIPPVVGTSSLIVRSDRSWHAVSPVADHYAGSRHSVTVTFYAPGSVSTMWPPGARFEWLEFDGERTRAMVAPETINW